MKKRLILATILLLAWPLKALEFEASDAAVDKPAAKPADKASVHDDSEVPQPIDAGDVPTAYSLLKYEMRADIRFYAGGGLLSKVNFGLFPRFSLGVALDVPGLIGAGPINLNRDDASILARFLLIKEDESFPALSLGWDGPDAAGGELRGLYLVASKEFRTPLGYAQAHGGINSSIFDGFVGSKDLRGFAALTTTFKQLTVFFEADELIKAGGPRLASGGRFYFEPISLGVEFRDLGATRANSVVSRVLRVSYDGLF